MIARAIEGVNSVESGPCCEFVGHRRPAVEWDALPARPGGVLRDAEGRATALHFAPRRWLAPVPDPVLLSRLLALEERGDGLRFDVDGKWQHLRVPSGFQALARSINVSAMLRDRDCAATVVFDCPAIVAAHEGTVDLWIAASYLDSFLDAYVGCGK